VSQHGFDYLDVSQDQISLVECKTQEELEELVETNPTSWVRDSNSGMFRCLPYEAAAQKLGLTARIFADTEVSPIQCGNLSVLKDALRNVPTKAAGDIYADAKAILERDGAATLCELARRLRLQSPVPLIRLIAERRLGAALGDRVRPEAAVGAFGLTAGGVGPFKVPSMREPIPNPKAISQSATLFVGGAGAL